MSIFEFLMVLVSLIIGLGIAELLRGIAGAIRNRKTIEFYWVHSAFIFIVFIALLQQWWEIWGLNVVETWTFGGLIMMLAGPVGLFLIASLLFPKRIEHINMRTFYYEGISAVMWIAAATVIIASSFRPVIFGHNIFSPDNISSFILVAIFITLALVKKPVVHSILVVLILVLVLFDTLYFRLQIQ